MIWCIGIYSEILANISNSFLFVVIPFKFIGSLVCHQDTSKLIELNGMHSLVCARCSGIYSGAFLASLFFLFNSIRNDLSYKWLIIAVIPSVLDIIFYTSGLYEYSKIISFCCGLLLGSIGILYFYVGIENYYSERKQRHQLN